MSDGPVLAGGDGGRARWPLAPRWRKVLRDIGNRPQRAALAVVAMAAGVFALGMVLTSWAILRRELATTFTASRPAAAILLRDGPLSDAQVAAVRRLPGVLDAEARPVIGGRIRVRPQDDDDTDTAPGRQAGADTWAPLVVFVVRDFADLRVDRLTSQAGAWPPAAGEMLLERSALSVAGAEIGDSVIVRPTGGAEQTLRIAGTVHAPGLAPAFMEHVVYGFVAWSSVLHVAAAAPGERTELRLFIAGTDPAAIRIVAERVRAALSNPVAGAAPAVRIRIPTPGRHPHADQMDTFLFLLGAFGVLTAALSALLTANMIHALLIEEVRQVGIMKAIGASTAQVAALYLGQVALLAALSLCLGMPLGLWAGRGYAGFAATMLNVDLASAAVPAWLLLTQGAIGLAVPLAVACWPVRRAAAITVLEALRQDAGIASFAAGRLDTRLARRRWLSWLKWLPRPFRLSLRTTFRRRGRLLLTVGTLAAGGAVFIAALDVSASLDRTLDADAATRRYDLAVRLPQPPPAAALAAALATVPEVAAAETWSETTADLGVEPARGTGTGRAGNVAGTSASESGDSDSAAVAIIGPDRGSRLIAPDLLAGRWLRTDDAAVAVVNQALVRRHPALRLGSTLALRSGTHNLRWPVVGIVRELLPTPTVYAPAAAVRALAANTSALPGTRSGSTVRIVTRHHDAAAQRFAAGDVERSLVHSGIDVVDVRRMGDWRQALKDHFVIVVSALLLAAGLMIVVGGLGLSAALTLNVVERTREIGILGVLGAAPRVIAAQVVVEGVLLALLSWGAALLVALPVTALLDAVAGRIFVGQPFVFAFSPAGAALWLLIVLVLGAASSWPPAWRAARLTVSEALAYA